MTITEFLLARIAEDEAIAQRQRSDLEKEFGKAVEVQLFSELGQDGIGHMGYPVIVVDHSRVLAECEAKRRIVERYERMVSEAGAMVDLQAQFWRTFAGESKLAMHDLAAVYADHADYCDEWRP